jgi:hypothetical protein
MRANRIDLFLKNKALICFLLVTALALFHIFSFSTDADDAYITYRYAKNLASGNGPVFNAGEKVEGYSNFSWMMILGFLKKVFLLDIPVSAKVLGTIISLITILLTYKTTLLLIESKLLGFLTAIFLAASGSFVAYASSGLETPLFSLLMLAIVYFLIKDFKKAIDGKPLNGNNNKFTFVITGILYSLLTMTRPEGVLFVLPIVFWIVYTKKSKALRISSVSFLVTSGIILGIWNAWRIYYYGHIMPNALMAKTGMDALYQINLGFYYIMSFSKTNIPLLLFFGIGFLFALVNVIKNNRQKEAGKTIVFETPDLFIALLLVLYTMFYVYAGGDWMPAFRFISPLFPLIWFLSMRLYYLNIYQRVKSRREIFTTIICIIICSSSLTISFKKRNMIPEVRIWTSQVKGLAEIGRWFNKTLPNETKIAVFANGAFSYYSMLPTIDVLGLTDEHIAFYGKRFKRGMVGHAAYDDDYVISQKPEIIVILRQGFEKTSRKYNYADSDDYASVSLYFLNTENSLGKYANILVLKTEKEKLIKLLTRKNQVEYVQS